MDTSEIMDTIADTDELINRARDYYNWKPACEWEKADAGIASVGFIQIGTQMERFAGVTATVQPDGHMPPIRTTILAYELSNGSIVINVITDDGIHTWRIDGNSPFVEFMGVLVKEDKKLNDYLQEMNYAENFAW